MDPVRSKIAELYKTAPADASGLSIIKSREKELTGSAPFPSNLIIFIGFFTLVSALFFFAIIFAITPTLLPIQFVILTCLLLASGLAAIGYALFLRSERASYQAMAMMEQQNLITTMATQISTLRDRQNNLRRAYGEEKLRAEEARNSKVAFLAHLNHDFRTPLNHIIGFADLISHQTFGPVGDERYLSYIGDIKKSGEELLRAISGVIELSELEAGHKILTCEKVVIGEILHAVEKKFSSRAKRCGVKLDIDCSCEQVLFNDRAGIERIIGNLLDNAVRFTPSGGQVRIGAWVANEGIVLEITDTGIGIAKGKLAALFEPFSLEDASKYRERGGTGTGLAIARAIAELSGGELAIDSMLGIGTTVAVSLPMNADKQMESAQAA
ncbi:MAG: HAMP domain-containing histidine kinase [Devosiaceae bacterium]|nr:HAMP domain-containing histidine kinase [Devosiaceae bacterium]